MEFGIWLAGEARALTAPEADLTLEDRHRVFVSYSRRDFYFAEQLAVALGRRGLAVWFDVHELAAGTDWSAAIDRAIVECDSFVLVASPAALESSDVERERAQATQLGRPQVAVLAGRPMVSLAPSIPTYDLRSSFKRGAGALAGDLAKGRQTGRRPRVRLPYPETACLVALAPALGVVFAIVLAVMFARGVVGHKASLVPNADAAVALAAGMIALVGAWHAAILWAFLKRRVTWRYLRGYLFGAPLVTLVALSAVEQLAGYLTTDPLLRALAGAQTMDLGAAPAFLALLVVLASVAAAIATEFSSGVCRFLRTGIAPRRVRARHIGAIPRPAGRRDAVRSYRLLAADDDAGVADEIRRCLAESGIDQVTGGEGDRDIVVLTDKTPADWPSRDDLRLPVAVVATSISLPVRGILHRFQWVDYRARRRSTLRTLGRDLVGTRDPVAGARAAPEIPERLQQRRLPLGVAITDWTLYCMAVLATLAAAYPAALLAFTDRPADAWPSALCIAVAPVLVLLARWLRRRRITLPLLLGAIALCWLAMIACGLDGVLQALSPSYDRGSFSTLTVIYPAISAVVIALAWRSLRRWLPRRARVGALAGPTLGSVRGSFEWLTIFISALAIAVGAIVGNAPEPSAVAPLTAPADVCRDQAGLEAFTRPLPAANKAIQKATRETIVAAFEHQIHVATGVIHEVEGYEPSGSWGAHMKIRLIAGLERTIRADRALLRHETTGRKWARDYDELIRAYNDMVAPVC